jgi:hypothetical protein
MIFFGPVFGIAIWLHWRRTLVLLVLYSAILQLLSYKKIKAGNILLPAI